MPRSSDRAPQDRPAFPAEAVDWLVGTAPSAVLTVGDDQLAAAVADAGHRVTALADITSAARLPEARFDSVVVVGELRVELETLADRLRPGGFLGVVRHDRDHRVPWARRLDSMLGTVPADDQLVRLIECPRFATIEPAAYRYWQPVDAPAFEALVRREGGGDGALAAARELYAAYARDRHGLLMPWVSTCHRAVVVERIWAVEDAAIEAPAPQPEGLVLISLS